MTREVATCGEAETAVSIMERMTTGRFRHVPVVERDQLVGIVSIGDIVKHRLWVMEQESATLREYIQERIGCENQHLSDSFAKKCFRSFGEHPGSASAVARPR
jgi:predicted transcriptional regulator